MKNDWFRVLEGSINLPYDENLAYELEVFLKDFVYLRKEEDKIILLMMELIIFILIFLHIMIKQ